MADRGRLYVWGRNRSFGNSKQRPVLVISPDAATAIRQRWVVMPLSSDPRLAASPLAWRHETRTALKGHPYRAHIGHLHHSAIGHGDFPQRFLFQLKLHHDMFGNAKHQGTSVSKGRDL